MRTIHQLVSNDGNDAIAIDAALRLQLGVGADKDTLIGNLIAQARDYAERITQRTLRELVTRKLLCDQWVDYDSTCVTRATYRGNREAKIYLPYPPIVSIEGVTYYDADNVSQSVSSSLYRLQIDTNGGGFIDFDQDFTFPALYDRSDAVTITYVSGYSTQANMPGAARAAITLLVLALYDHDDDASTKVAEQRAKDLLLTLAMPRYA